MSNVIERTMKTRLESYLNADNIHAKREQLGMTRGELAGHLGIAPSTLRRYLSGGGGRPNVEHVVALSSTLKMDFADILRPE